MKFWRDYTPLERLCLVFALASGPFSAYGAYRFSFYFLGHHLGTLPELIGGIFFVFVPTMMGRGVEEMRRPRLEQQKREAEEYVRKLNSN